MSIKDSGERSKFQSGAVRDMRKGKGRCDLFPYNEVREVFSLLENKKQSSDSFDVYTLPQGSCVSRNIEELTRITFSFLEIARFNSKLLSQRESEGNLPYYKRVSSTIRNTDIDTDLVDSGGEGSPGLVKKAIAHAMLCALCVFIVNRYPVDSPDYEEDEDDSYGYYSQQCVRASFSKAMLELAVHFEEGGAKYGDDNWRKGLPFWCYLDSATRHYIKWVGGMLDEPHDRAYMWNLICGVWSLRNLDEETLELCPKKTSEQEERK